MKTKGIVNIAISRDGYIAREDGDIDWLDKANSAVPVGEDCGFAKFMRSIGALVMGRKSYEKVLSFGVWPYGDTPVIVQSRKPIEFPPDAPSSVSHSSESPSDLFERLNREGIERVYIDGGTTIQRFLQAEIIDEITLTVIPVLIGSGIPLFGSLREDITLSHKKTITYDFGFVQSTYLVTKKMQNKSQ